MKELLENLYSEEVYNIPRQSAVVVLSEPWEKLGEAETILLSKILTAIKLSMASVKIVMLPVLDLENESHVSMCTSDVLLLFGTSVKQSVEPYKKVIIKNFRIIQSEPLHLLDEKKKRDLWLALKDLFA